MVSPRKALPAQADVAHWISAAALAAGCPRALIEQLPSPTGDSSVLARRYRAAGLGLQINPPQAAA